MVLPMSQSPSLLSSEGTNSHGVIYLVATSPEEKAGAPAIARTPARLAAIGPWPIHIAHVVGFVSGAMSLSSSILMFSPLSILDCLEYSGGGARAELAISMTT
jgi:hypothetical protein